MKTIIFILLLLSLSALGKTQTIKTNTENDSIAVLNAEIKYLKEKMKSLYAEIYSLNKEIEMHLASMDTSIKKPSPEWSRIVDDAVDSVLRPKADEGKSAYEGKHYQLKSIGDI